MKFPSFALLSLAAPAALHAASFNCAKAGAAQEKLICTTPSLSKADDSMAAAYKESLAKTPESARQPVRDQQRAWAAAMAGACPAKASRSDMAACLASYEEDRITALRSLVVVAGGITFYTTYPSFAAPDPKQKADAPAEDEDSDDVRQAVQSVSWYAAHSSAPEWQAWNQAVAARAAKLVDNKVDGKGRWTPLEGNVDMDESMKLGIVNTDLVTATLEYDFYFHGGAHPGHTSVELNWLLKQQRPLKPEDVFLPGSGWQDFLYLRTDAYLHKTLDDGDSKYDAFFQPGEMAKTLKGIVTDPENWSIDEHGITIVFQQYAVACYACTPEPYLLPWKLLKPYLSPSFSIPHTSH